MVKPPSQELPAWVPAEVTKTRQATPKSVMPQKRAGVKPALKPAEPVKPVRLHVRVQFKGEITLVLEGQDAKDLRTLLDREPSCDEVLDALDPWSSGAVVTQRVHVFEEPAAVGKTCRSWFARERTKSFYGVDWPWADGPFAGPVANGYFLLDWNRVP